MACRAALFGAVLHFFPVAAVGSEGEISLVRQATPLSEVTFEAAKLQVQGSKITAEIDGTFSSPQHSLLVQLKAPKVDPATRKFRVVIECTALSTPMMVSLVSQKGAVRSETVQIQLKTSEDFASFKRSLLEPAPRLTHFTVGLGMASLTYGQPGIASFNQVALSGRASVLRDIPKFRIWADLSAYSTLLPLSSSIEGTSLRQFGLNLRVGRKILQFAGDWDLIVSGGGFYTSTVSNQGDFGFRDLYGAQIQPAITRPLGRRGEALTFYGKYVPLFARSLNEREIAVGAQLQRALPNDRVLNLNLDYSDIAFNTTTSGGGLVFSRNTVLSASIQF